MKTLVDFINERKMGENWQTLTKGNYVATFLVFDEPSQYGIDEGRISKLEIRKGKHGEVLCNYDRDWDVEPKKEVEEFYNEIIKTYN